MDLDQLKSFVVIARERNLTRAAGILHLSQSALSSQLRRLEDGLAVTLFRRTTRGMELTEEGRELLPLAEATLESARKVRQKALDLNRGLGESVIIGLNADPTFLRVGAIARRLSLLHSELGAVFHTSQTVRTAQLLRQGQVDLAFFYGEASDADIRHTLLARIRICVVIPAPLAAGGEELGWREVAALPWIWVGHDSPFYAALGEQMERRGLLPAQAVAAVDEHIVKELVRDGRGAAVMREDEAIPLLEEGRVAIWPQGWMTVPLSLAWLEKNSEKKKIRATLETIRYVWQDARGEDGDLLASYRL